MFFRAASLAAERVSADAFSFCFWVSVPVPVACTVNRDQLIFPRCVFSMRSNGCCAKTGVAKKPKKAIRKRKRSRTAFGIGFCKIAPLKKQTMSDRVVGRRKEKYKAFFHMERISCFMKTVYETAKQIRVNATRKIKWGATTRIL